MGVEALPVVNWIFWAWLTAGSLVVVGVTEWLGGTTRGYRLLMAWLIGATAIVLVLSELALPSIGVTDASAAIRRPLALALAAGALGYLVATLRAWPRSWLAIGAGLVGLGAMVALAIGGGSDAAALFAIQLVIGATALGSVWSAMWLGHWYLVTPKLSPTPLRRLMWLHVGSLVAQAIAFGLAITLVGTAALEGDIAWLTWLRLGAGIILPIVATSLALLASRAASLQASTGLLYIGLALVMAGSIAGASLTYLTGVPV
jgi:hypothetical protein